MKILNFKKLLFIFFVLGIILSRLCLVSKYPGDVDPALYLISLSKIFSSTFDKTADLFNYEMSSGYYWLISIVYKFSHNDMAQLVVIQNYMSSFFGICIIFIFGILAKRLAGEAVALFGMLILLLDHSLWNWSLYGHPTVSSVFFFLLSLYFFDRSITREKAMFRLKTFMNSKLLYVFLSILSAIISLLLRADILFVFASYYLLLDYRLNGGRNFGRKLLVFYVLILSAYLIVKVLALGYVFDFMDNVLTRHVSRQLSIINIPIAIINNIGIFAAGMGIFYVIGGLISMAIFSAKHNRLRVGILISIAPVFVVAFFERMDFARITILIHPIIAFFAAIGIKNILLFFKKFSVSLGIVVIISAYVLQTLIVYYPLRTLWMRKFPYQPSFSYIVIRPVPIGWFITDRINRIRDENRLFRHALFLSAQKKYVSCL